MSNCTSIFEVFYDKAAASMDGFKHLLFSDIHFCCPALICNLVMYHEHTVHYKIV